MYQEPVCTNHFKNHFKLLHMKKSWKIAGVRKILHIQPVGGASGDMILGALFDCGVSFPEWKKQIEALPLTGLDITKKRVKRSSIQAMQVRISADETSHHRSLSTIQKLIGASSLSSTVKEKSIGVFDRLGKVEAALHGVPVSKVHFHEVGAVDSIVDIVGAVLGMEMLGVQVFVSDPLRLGTGQIKAAHGMIPVPSPATAELVKRFPVIMTGIPAELTTPTAAALITSLCQPAVTPIPMTMKSIGYGAGMRELVQVPNVLRMVIGETTGTFEEDSVMQVECNIDDMTAELMPPLMEQILNAGALDAYLSPVLMKKGRPGHLLTILSDQHVLDSVLSIVFRESSTIGVRVHSMNRYKLPRRTVRKRTPLGVVSCKEITFEGRTRFIPEYEECRKIAQQQKLPLPDVYMKLTHYFQDTQ